MKRLYTVMLVVGGWMLGASAADAPDLSQAPMDALLVHVQQYGNTVGRKRMRKAARAEIVARGTNSFQYLMNNFHVESFGIRMMADEMVRRHLDDAPAADVLLQYLDSPHDITRKSAAFFLGFGDTPQHADKLMPLLGDDEAAGGAIRTLGKWSHTNAVPGILARLHDDDERRRIIAVNALGGIRDPLAVAPLIGMLNDSVFTVRKAASNALAGFDASADGAIADALLTAERVAQREIVGLLARRGQTAATNDLAVLMARDLSTATKVDVESAIELLQRSAD